VGDGTFSNRTTPVQVTGLGSGVVAVAANYNFSLALKSDGTALAWGENSTSQLGNGYISPVLAPMQNLLRGLYRSPGSIVGLKFDAGGDKNWGVVAWNGATPLNTAISFRSRAAASKGGLDSATWSAPYTSSGTAITSVASRWLELELQLSSSDGAYTPILNDCSITYATHYDDSTPPTGLDNATPLNGASDLQSSVMLNSTIASDSESGGVQYYFQVALDNSFSNGIQSSGWQTATSYAPTLATKSTYYWRAKARDGAHNETPYTSAWSFTTIFAPAPPTIAAALPLSTTAIRWNFTDTTNNEDGFMLHDATQTVKANSATTNLSYLDETGLNANTSYTRHIHTYNMAGVSTASGDVSSYTLALPPNVSSDKPASTWFNSANVTFTNTAGFGSGGLQYYRYVWDQNPTHNFTDTETTWPNGTLTATATAVGSWYLHVKGYNGDGIASDKQDYGPFLYDNSAPTGLTNTSPADLSTNIANGTTITATVVTDSDSGSAQYYFQVAFDNAFTKGVVTSGWQGGTTYAPTLLNGKTYYWHVKSRDGAGNETPYTTTWQFATEGQSVTWTTKGDFDSASTKLLASGVNPTDDSAVSILYNTDSLAAGSIHSLALRPNGTVQAWGYNYYGQLGDGTTASQGTPITVKGAALTSDVIAIAAGSHSSYALKSDGSVWAWGYNLYGQLGDNSSTNRTLPVQVSGFGTGSGVISIKAGATHTIALKADGSVWTWGENYSGQLGDGTIPYEKKVPVKVFNAGSRVIAIAAGGNNSIALKADGSVWTWGRNDYGQVGNGGSANQPTPIKIIDVNSGVIGISAGSNHSLALKSDGTVLAWGLNSSGQLGDNSTTNRNIPVQVFGLGTNSGVTMVKAGGSHSLAVRSDGSVLAWGLNTNGQVGDNSATTMRIIPVTVANIGVASPVISVATGGYHSMAVKSDLSLLVWGWNNYGELGLANNQGGNVTAPTSNLISSVKFPVFYFSAGTISKKFDANTLVNWKSTYWDGSTPPNTIIKCRTRGASNEALLGSAIWSEYSTNPLSTITTAPSQWLEVELTLESSDNTATPIVNDITVDYHP